MKKISVIIPCYNVAPYIDRCLTSVVNQTTGAADLEIICIDDASSDDTWLHLQRWKSLWPDQMVLYRQKVNGRQGTARNIGLSIASADWITFVDADDWLEADCFELLYKPVTRFECDVVCCGWVRDYADSLTCFDDENRNAGAGEEQYIIGDGAELTRYLLRFKKLGAGPVGKLIRRKLLLDREIFFRKVWHMRIITGLPCCTYMQKRYILQEKICIITMSILIRRLFPETVTII